MRSLRAIAKGIDPVVTARQPEPSRWLRNHDRYTREL